MCEVQVLTGHSGRVWSCSWNPNGTLLATCGEDTNIRLWGQEDNKWVIKTILTEGHTRTARSVGWSVGGKFIACASFDGTVSIWDKKSGQYECNATLEGHENEVKSVAWSPSGNFLATCSRDKSVWVWDVDEEEDEYMCASVLQAHTQDVKKVKWHPHEDILVSCSYDNKIKFFREDDDDWVCFATISGHDSTVWSIAFNSQGNRLASCSDDKTVKVWQEFKPGNQEGIATVGNDPTWKCISTLSGFHSRAIYDLDWSALDGLLVTACGDNAIRVFKEDEGAEVENGQTNFSLVCTVQMAHSEDVNAVAWNPKGKELLASCSDDGEVKIWQLRSENS